MEGYEEFNTSRPFLNKVCPYCNGTKEVKVYPNIDIINGFEDVDWSLLSTNWTEDMISFTCVCGEDVIVSFGEKKACDCGRVYYIKPWELQVDNTFIGKIDKLLEYINNEN